MCCIKRFDSAGFPRKEPIAAPCINTELMETGVRLQTATASRPRFAWPEPADYEPEPPPLERRRKTGEHYAILWGGSNAGLALPSQEYRDVPSLLPPTQSQMRGWLGLLRLSSG